MAGTWFSLCGVGLLCAFSALLLRTKSGELALLLRVGGFVLMAGVLVLSMREPLAEIGGLVEGQEISEAVTVMLKALGIALVCGVCGDICRDCGEGSIATCVETAGNLMILSLSLPVIREILDVAAELLSME